MNKVKDMNDRPSLRIAQLQILGQVLAHLAHDIQNHLAIINESAGWMKDLLEMKNKQRFGWIRNFFKSGQKQGIDPDPFFNGLNIIEKHIDRASTMTQGLNSFAHRLEKPRSVFNGNKALEETMDVLLKQARDKGIRLELKLAEEPSMIETDPSGFQLAVFDNAWHVIERLKNGDCLTLETQVSDDQFRVRLTSPCREAYKNPLIKGPDGRDLYQHIVEDLGGQIQRQSFDEMCVTTLAFSQANGKI